jgi:ribonuclease VapC
MIVDSSAIISILQDEPDAKAFAAALLRDTVRRMSVVTWVEAAIVTDGNRNPVLSRRFDDLLRDVRMRVETVTPRQAEIARQAYRDFGKGRHKAGLNFGDCFSYALAKEMDEPLLFKGRDFSRTDVEVAEIKDLKI